MMVALDSDEDPITLFGNMPILSLLMNCLRQIGSERETNDPSDPAHEIAHRVIIVMLKDNSFSEDYPSVDPAPPSPRSSYGGPGRPLPV